MLNVTRSCVEFNTCAVFRKLACCVIVTKSTGSSCLINLYVMVGSRIALTRACQVKKMRLNTFRYSVPIHLSTQALRNAGPTQQQQNVCWHLPLYHTTVTNHIISHFSCIRTLYSPPKNSGSLLEIWLSCWIFGEIPG